MTQLETSLINDLLARGLPMDVKAADELIEQRKIINLLEATVRVLSHKRLWEPYLNEVATGRYLISRRLPNGYTQHWTKDGWGDCAEPTTLAQANYILKELK